MDVPEQITAAPQTSASDLFGLGLLLYRCLHGHLPDETASSYLQLAYSRTQTPISVPPSILQGLLERCLALDPAQRPQSAAEVLAALLRIALTAAEAAWESRDWAADCLDSAEEWPYAAGEWREAADERGPAQYVPWGRPQNMGDWATLALKSKARRRALAGLTLVVLAVTVLVAGIALLGVGNGLARVGVGLAIVGVALAVAQQIRRRWTSRAPEAERRAATILFGAGQRDELTRSLRMEVDQV